MYNDFYGFSQTPFNITPDPRFLFFSDKHREALSHLYFGITQRKGFVVLTGDVGAGKTTICRALLEKLGPTWKTALILNPTIDPVQLLRAILVELGQQPTREQDKVELLDMLNRYLLAEAQAGNDVVVLIDEAQDATLEMLEQIRLLSNLETDERKLLQIVLMGQPELREKLDDPRLKQLRQRITVRYHLTPLTKHEMEHYIRHRIHVAGGNGRPSFSWWALQRLHRYTGGVPRLINAVCDKTLLCGFVNNTDHFTRKHVTRAIRELEGKFA